MLNNTSSDDKWHIHMEQNRHVANTNYYLFVTKFINMCLMTRIVLHAIKLLHSKYEAALCKLVSHLIRRGTLVREIHQVYLWFSMKPTNF